MTVQILLNELTQARSTMAASQGGGSSSQGNNAGARPNVVDLDSLANGVPIMQSPANPFELDQLIDSFKGMENGGGASVSPFLSEAMLLDMAFPSIHSGVDQFPVFPVAAGVTSTALDSFLPMQTAQTSGQAQQPIRKGAIENAFQDSISSKVVDESPSSNTNLLNTNPDGLLWSIIKSEEERDRLLRISFEIINRHLLPHLHEGYFWKRLRSNDNRPAQSLLLAMCALAATARTAPDGSVWPRSIFSDDDAIDANAETMVNAAILSLDLEIPSVDQCQALLLLVLMKANFLPLDPETSQEWLLSGMAMRMVSMLKLDVDPDVLERQSGRRWPWVEKETRRRVFAAVCMLDELDMVFRERSFGVWRRRKDVRPPVVSDVWRSVDPETGEPALLAILAPTTDATLLMLGILALRCKVSELNLTVGAGLSSIKKALKIAVDSHAPPADSMPTPAVTMTPGLENPDAQDVPPEIQFAVLDAEFSMWHQSLPPHLTWSRLAEETEFTVTYDMSGSSNKPYQHSPFGALKMHFNYLSGLLALHRPRLIRELRLINISNANDPSSVELSDRCQDSLRKCAKAALRTTLLIRRKVLIVSPAPHASRPRPVASYLQISAGIAMPLLESGLMNAFFLLLMGVGRLPGTHENLSAPALQRKVAEVLGGVVGSRFKEDALVGLSAVMKMLKTVDKRTDIQMMREVLERVVERMGLTTHLVPVSELDEFEKLE
ncbi:hypothetical protein HK101_008542 [Irineochytrium annulatum]|nr:hypothetical protein HK101_008542 [Irineochytrium annulatum]